MSKRPPKHSAELVVKTCGAERVLQLNQPAAPWQQEQASLSLHAGSRDVLEHKQS